MIPIIFAQSGIFDKPEYDSFAEACGQYNVEFRKMEFKDILREVGRQEDSSHCWLWGSVEAHKILPLCRSMVNWNVYADTFYRQYVPKELFLNQDVNYCLVSDLPGILVDNTRLFVRPIGGDKVFTGALLKNIDTASLKRDLWVAKSPEKDIGAEYRFIVQKGCPYNPYLGLKEQPYRIVSGARYITEDEKIVQSFQYKENRLDPTHSAWEAAAEILLRCETYLYFANKTFTMDVCWDREAKAYKIVEFNSFWSAGIYGNDVSEVVRAIGEIYTEKKYG